MLLSLSRCLVGSGVWGVVKVALKLIPTSVDLPDGDVSQGNIGHPGSHFPEKLHSPSRLELIGKVLPLLFMP